MNVEPGSDVEIIKSSFRKLAMELHPDRNPSEKAHQYFIIVQNAYQYLLDHPYTKQEVEALLRQKQEFKHRPKISFEQAIHYKPNPLSTATLREIIRVSSTAKILFIVFHILFITVGTYLIYRAIFNMLFYRVDIIYNPVGPYLVLWFGLILGIIITAIFLYTGINFIRNRYI